MERATYTTKSFIVALALVKRHLTADQAAEAAQVEVNSQIERWGEVEDCESSKHRGRSAFPGPTARSLGLFSLRILEVLTCYQS
jgi:chaperone required for assembly of F1-ATPase